MVILIEKWKLSLKEFLKNYEEDDNVVGAILCGSYANATQNEYSNLEVYLVLKNEAGYTEMGVCDFNSYLIEYFIDSESNIKRNMKNEFEMGKLNTVNMFAFGKIIYDLNGSVKSLQDEALRYIDDDIKVISSFESNYNNYYIWKLLNELKISLNENSMQFNLTYYKLLDKVFTSYLRYLGIPIILENKIYNILIDENYRRKCHVYKLPEEEFINLYLKCFNIEKPSIMYKNIDNLINYFYKKQGGFSIRTFKIREELLKY